MKYTTEERLEILRVYERQSMKYHAYVNYDLLWILVVGGANVLVLRR